MATTRVAVGAEVEMQGSWGEHKSYGEQFEFSAAKRVDAAVSPEAQERCQSLLLAGVE